MAKDNSPSKQPKRRCKRRPKSRLNKIDTHTDPSLEQGKAVDGEHATKQSSEHGELDKQPIPGEKQEPRRSHAEHITRA